MHCRSSCLRTYSFCLLSSRPDPSFLIFHIPALYPEQFSGPPTFLSYPFMLSSGPLLLSESPFAFLNTSFASPTVRSASTPPAPHLPPPAFFFPLKNHFFPHGPSTYDYGTTTRPIPVAPLPPPCPVSPSPRLPLPHLLVDFFSSLFFLKPFYPPLPQSLGTLFSILFPRSFRFTKFYF